MRKIQRALPHLPTNDVLIIWIANYRMKLRGEIWLQPWLLFVVRDRRAFVIWRHLHLGVISIGVVNNRFLHLRLFPLTGRFVFIVHCSCTTDTPEPKSPLVTRKSNWMMHICSRENVPERAMLIRLWLSHHRSWGWTISALDRWWWTYFVRWIFGDRWEQTLPKIGQNQEDRENPSESLLFPCWRFLKESKNTVLLVAAYCRNTRQGKI